MVKRDQWNRLLDTKNKRGLMAALIFCIRKCDILDYLTFGGSALLSFSGPVTAR
jgi:hypothetical protein